MAKVKVSKPFTMTVEDVRRGMQDIANHLAQEEGMKYQWKNDDCLTFTHKTGKGSLTIEGQELFLELKISMLYAAAAPMVKKKVLEFADQYIS